MEATSMISMKYKNPPDVHKPNLKWQNGNIRKYRFHTIIMFLLLLTDMYELIENTFFSHFKFRIL